MTLSVTVTLTVTVCYCCRFVRVIDNKYTSLARAGPEKVLSELCAELAELPSNRPPAASRKVRRLVACAKYEVLRAEFKRKHKLTHVKKFASGPHVVCTATPCTFHSVHTTAESMYHGWHRFAFVNYLRKALRTHVIEIVEPSKITWAILIVIHVIIICADDGAEVAIAHGFHHTAEGEGAMPHNYGPHPVYAGPMIVLIAWNWLLLLATCTLWFLASRGHAQCLSLVYTPHADVWREYFEAQRPDLPALP